MKFIDVSKKKKELYTVDTPDTYIFFLYNVSGKVVVDIKSPRAKVYLYGIYIGKGRDRFMLSTVQHHESGSSISDLLIKGVFFDESKFIYKGLIRIEKKAQKSSAYQKNQNLVMSHGVFVDSKPFLEILANDVRCTHGSTTGKLNQDQIYYAQTRKISLKRAQNMLIEGFIDDIFHRMQALGYNMLDDKLQICKKRLPDF